MPAKKKKKIHEHVKAKVVDWDEKMKKYRFYKEIVKDFLLMVPLLGTVGTTLINWAYKAFFKYAETASAIRESAPVSRRSASPPPMADAPATTSSAPSMMSEPLTMLDLIQYSFIFWLTAFVVWRIWKKIKTKKEEA